MIALQKLKTRELFNELFYLVIGVADAQVADIQSASAAASAAGGNARKERQQHYYPAIQ